MGSEEVALPFPPCPPRRHRTADRHKPLPRAKHLHQTCPVGDLRPILAADLTGARKAHRAPWETSLPEVERTVGAGWAMAGAAATQAATGAFQDCISRVLHARCRTPGQSRIHAGGPAFAAGHGLRPSAAVERAAPHGQIAAASAVTRSGRGGAAAPRCPHSRAVPPIAIAESHDLELF
jgi:hypothetical protein